jgi:hypothetical protein
VPTTLMFITIRVVLTTIVSLAPKYLAVANDPAYFKHTADDKGKRLIRLPTAQNSSLPVSVIQGILT